MDVDSFYRMYVAELLELRSVKEQLVQALPKMVRMADHPDLKEAFVAHHEETGLQRNRLGDLLQGHAANPCQHRDGSMQAIITEAERWAELVEDRDLRDAGLIRFSAAD